MWQQFMAAVCFLSALTATVSQQWIPLTGKVKETSERTVNGKIAEVKVREGDFYRASDGSTLEQWKEGGPTALNDNTHLLSYQLDYNKKTAIAKPMPQAMGKIDVEATRRKALGHSTVNGFACTFVPLYFVRSPGSRTLAGTACVSEEYATDLRTEMTVSVGNTTDHVVWELNLTKTNQEPDRKLFEVPKDFTVLGPGDPPTH